MKINGMKKGLLFAVMSLILLSVSIALLTSKISSASNNLQSIALSPQVTSPTCMPGLIFYSSTTNQFMACNSTGTPATFVTNLSGGSQLNAAYITQGTFGSGAAGSNNQYLFQPSTDNTSVLKVLNALGTVPVFDVDTANQRVGIGTAAPSSALTVNGTITLTGSSGTITGLAAPVNASDAATKAYVDAASGGGVTWAGYTTSTYQGNIGGLRAGNSICNANYAGSHWASYDEIASLGVLYPWTQNAWVQNALAVWTISNTSAPGSQPVYIAKDGSVYEESSVYADGGSCSGWRYNGSNYEVGTYLGTGGSVGFGGCQNNFYLACVK